MNDPTKWTTAQQEKKIFKYLNEKVKGIRKCITEMIPQQQRMTRRR